MNLFNVFYLPIFPSLTSHLPLRLSNLNMSSSSSPGHRVVVYYQTQYNGKKYVSPTPLISVATHLIIAAFHLNDGKDDNSPKTVTVNNVSPDDSTLTQMWIDVAHMQESGVKVMCMLGGASDGSFQHLDRDFDDYYAPLKSCITQ